MNWYQKEIKLQARPRGFHIVTHEILDQIPEIKNIKTGMLQVYIRHTSASLTINEDADPSVRDDFESWFNKTVRENDPVYTHTSEGPDDMPAHLKAALLGTSVMIPVTDGKPALGTWQGIYLCEHRNHGGRRTIVITAFGEGY